MTSSIRVVLLGIAVAGALAFAGAAAAVPTVHPILVTSNLDSFLGTQELILAVSPGDSPVAEATMYVGPGDVMTLRPTTAFGEADADFKANADYGNTIFSVLGEVTSANPAAYQNNTCAPGLHAAVWLAQMDVIFLDVTITIPIYVDPAPPSAHSYASYVLKACMPSPYEAYPQGAIFGGKLVDLQLYLYNFTTAVDNRWTGVATPYASGGGGTDGASAAEAQSVVSQGEVETLKVRQIVHRHHHGKHKTLYFAHVSGRVTMAGVGVPAQVQVYEFFSKEGGPRVGITKADDSGAFSATVRQYRTATFVVVGSQYGQLVTPPACNPVLEIGFGPLTCSSVTTTDFYVAKVGKKVKIPKRGRGLPAGEAARILHSPSFLSRAGGRFSP